MKRLRLTVKPLPASRRGSAMVFGLIALLFASMMIVGVLRTVSMSHRQLKREEFHIQANLLADSGCARVVALLERQSDLTGDTWSVPSEQLANHHAANVQLKVVNDPTKPDIRIISVVVEYPVGHPDLIRITRSISLPGKS